MRFQIACGCFCFFSLLVITAWSSKTNIFRRVKSDAGEPVCGMSPANKTLQAVEAIGLCTAACFHVRPSLCQAINYWSNARVCEHFYYIPCSYEVQQDCENFQVTIVEFRIQNTPSGKRVYCILYI